MSFGLWAERHGHCGSKLGAGPPGRFDGHLVLINPLIAQSFIFFFFEDLKGPILLGLILILGSNQVALYLTLRQDN